MASNISDEEVFKKINKNAILNNEYNYFIYNLKI
jgi:hypothetical protein